MQAWLLTYSNECEVLRGLIPKFCFTENHIYFHYKNTIIQKSLLGDIVIYKLTPYY